LRAAAGTASTRSCHALAHRAHHATHVPLTHALTEEQARAEGERETKRRKKEDVTGLVASEGRDKEEEKTKEEEKR
jgi:hypothetical protein